MTVKPIRVMEEEWDYLIILDACRYDYFSGMWRNYFNGELEKVISLGSCTPEWCLRSFQSYYPDVIYVSGNPYINSKVEIEGFNARRHFYKVVDVWEFGWNEELGTVPPEKVNEVVLSLIRRFPGKRFIVHYLQPHAPYISTKFQINGFPDPNPKYGRILSGVQGYRVNRGVETLVNLLGTLLVKTRLIKHVWELRELLNLPPASPMDAVRRKYGVDGLREAYRENLRIVLEHVAKLCGKLLRCKPSSVIIITSDHGELLGENGKYGHGIRDPYVLEVPWLRVKDVKGNVFDEDAMSPLHSAKPVRWSEKEKLRERIERLKKSGKV